MRKALGRTLLQLAQDNRDIVLIVGDIGFGVFDEYRVSFPDRFINAGIAEQAMVGYASGLAKEGLRPVVYTIAPFLIGRAYDQIRVDVAMHNRDVLLVGVGAGVAYGKLGPTHHSLDDIALARAVPNLRILSPSVPSRVEMWVKNWALDASGPTYLRLGRDTPELGPLSRACSSVHAVLGASRRGTAVMVSGSLFDWAYKLASEQCSLPDPPSLYSIEQIEPFPEDDVLEILSAHDPIVVAEESYPGSSLYSTVASLALRKMERHRLPTILPLTMDRRFYFEVSERETLLALGGIDVNIALQAIKGGRSA